LRDHGASASPRWSLLNGTLGAPCVHAAGLLASVQTTASWVSDLRGDPLHWATATAAPCTARFKPIRVGHPVDLGPAPGKSYDPSALWWRHERLHRATMADLPGLLPRYRHARDRVEAGWVEDPPGSSEAFSTADRLEARWLRDVEAVAHADQRPAWVRRAWRSLDRCAGIAA
jgi:secernin